MSKIFSILLASFLLLTFSACGLKEGVVQSDSKSYLSFSGNIQNAFVTIDNNKPFSLQDTEKNGNIVHYQLSPGKHTIVITKGGEIVVNREILLGNGATREVNIP